jgi:hypothetical protein
MHTGLRPPEHFDVVPKFVSPSDPTAQWTGAQKGPAVFAYSDNYLIDVKFGVIVDVEASRSIRQAEVGAARTMIERTEKAQPRWLSAAYGSFADKGTNYQIQIGVLFRYDRCPELRQETAVDLIAASWLACK